MNFPSSFTNQRIPKIVFGPGEIEKIGSLAAGYGKNILLVRGKSSLSRGTFREVITKSLDAHGITLFEYEISGEPSPEMIDRAVELYGEKSLDCVIAIGGGSVLDSGKAISAMLPVKQKVIQYLEIVGTKKTSGLKIPLIAIPTTSGTGSEASANSVISSIGVHGFKRSLRHENYVPDVALVDPQLTLTCPRDVTAACGMDALTQLIEAYVSPKATPFTDALVESALPLAGEHLVNAVNNGMEDLGARSAMSYASLVSGIALANAGLGVVHGLASLIGAFFPIPHGVVCGTLLAESVRANIKSLGASDRSSIFLAKYARVGRLVVNRVDVDDLQARHLLIEQLDYLTLNLSLPLLSDYGITAQDIDRFLSENVNKNNPVQLDNSQIRQFIALRIR